MPGMQHKRTCTARTITTPHLNIHAHYTTLRGIYLGIKEAEANLYTKEILQRGIDKLLVNFLVTDEIAHSLGAHETTTVCVHTFQSDAFPITFRLFHHKAVPV